jgi:hypothetical protein
MEGTALEALCRDEPVARREEGQGGRVGWPPTNPRYRLKNQTIIELLEIVGGQVREEGEQGVEPTRESEWREIEHTGDRERFIEEANRRRDERRENAKEEGKDLSKDRSPGAAQYVHVVISPENGERIRDEDFHQVAREWTHDESGREYPDVGAIHRDSRGEGHDHMHLLIARDKFSRDELQECKERSEDLVRDIERFRGLERDTERDTGRERETKRDRGEGREPLRQESREREPER